MIGTIGNVIINDVRNNLDMSTGAPATITVCLSADGKEHEVKAVWNIDYQDYVFNYDNQLYRFSDIEETE